ncbi:MAG: hypothetical protein IPP49_09535 [Saprospiraceae bacterium]|nr:hypothetical protein [Saprospiraceae bacterium]
MEVDLFAPGMKIYSTMPNNEYAPLQKVYCKPRNGECSSYIKSVFPALTTEQVKKRT